MFLFLRASRGLSPWCPYTYPEWQRHILSLDNRPFSVMGQSGPQVPGGGVLEEGRGDDVQRTLSGLPNHYGVSLHRMKALAYFCELHFW